MRRVRHVWLVFLLCAAVVVVAMAVVTRHALALEKARLQAAAETELGEKTRLALWRMDTEAAAILVAENNRPPAEFRNPSTGLQSQQQEPPVPDHVILRFEITDNGVISSPGADGEAGHAANLAKLRMLLGTDQNTRNAAGSDNLGKAVALANVDPSPFADQMLPPLAEVSKDAAPAQAAPQPQVAAAKNTAQTRAPSKEAQASLNEYNSRQAIVQRAVLSNKGNGLQQQEFQPGATPKRQRDELVQERSNAVQPTQVTSYRPLWLDGELFMVRAVTDAGGKRVQGVWLRADTLARSLVATLSDLLPQARLIPFQPVVFTPDTVLNAGNQSAPNTLAKLAASFTVNPGDHERAPLALVTLPWQLVPDEAAVVAMPGWSPLHTLLAVAWGGVVFALAAVAVLLAGVVALSERRASFVSSVTHELRTPLTTFRLYSEMLADDMVPDPDRRKTYLQTLQTEAARLTHLVENVLAYSRIERGSARARVEEITAEMLFSRLVPRFAERAAAAAMTLDLHMPANVGATRLCLDVTAVEQILFNLVDNACKYAVMGPAAPPLAMSVAHSNGILQVRLRDHGPGIPEADRRNVFKPFHKSAQQAAVSKPGVGLGLSLSRRLARALGGDLTLEASAGSGTCFLLVLPAKP